jgi:hypothetical protein
MYRLIPSVLLDSSKDFLQSSSHVFLSKEEEAQ